MSDQVENPKDRSSHNEAHKVFAGPQMISLSLLWWHIWESLQNYSKVPKFSDARKLAVLNLPKIQTKKPNLRVFCQKDANRIANSVDPDQTAPLGAV